MKLVWVYNHSPLSHAIRYCLNEPCSHFAMVFDERFVCHSNLFGVNLAWWKTFQGKNKIYATMDINLPQVVEEKIYTDIFDTFDGCSYDFLAFSFFIGCAVKHKVEGTPIPKQSQHQKSREFLCTEMLQLLPDEILPPNIKEAKKLDLNITSPYQLLLNCRGIHGTV
jgi:hypothetical protein